MIPADHLRQTTEMLEPAKSILVILPAEPTLDMVASGLALYLALSATGKQVSIYCSSSMTVEFSHLVGVDKITNTIGGDQGKNLVISFPYQEGSIEKVSYNIEQDTFNLVIEPREGYPMVTSDSIRFTYTGGGQPDMVITVGISKTADLQRALGAQAAMIEAKPLLSLDTNPQHERLGKVDIVMPSATALCEVATEMVTALSLRMDADIATNLLAGIIDASDTFSSPATTAQTFETAALLSRSGARKTPSSRSQQPTQQPPFRPQQQQPLAAPPRVPQYPMNQQQPYQQPQQRAPRQQPSHQQYQQPAPSNQPSFGRFTQQQQRQQPNQQQPRPFPAPPQQPQRQQPNQPQQQPPPAQQQQETPADWLKPKIYKGSTLA